MVIKRGMTLIKMNWMFVVMTIVSYLVAYLDLLLPNLSWTDFFYFFRKDKKDYLKFSSFFKSNYIINIRSSLFSFFIYVITAEFILQKKCSNHLKCDKVHSI